MSPSNIRTLTHSTSALAGDAWLSPCRCSGSTKWVHHTCLCRWVCLVCPSRRTRTSHLGIQVQEDSTQSAPRCPQCKTPYTVKHGLESALFRLAAAYDRVRQSSSQSTCHQRRQIADSISPTITATAVGALTWAGLGAFNCINIAPSHLLLTGAYTLLTIRVTCGADVLQYVMSCRPARVYAVLPLLPISLCLSRLRIHARLTTTTRRRQSECLSPPVTSVLLSHAMQSTFQRKHVAPVLGTPLSTLIAAPLQPRPVACTDAPRTHSPHGSTTSRSPTSWDGGHPCAYLLARC